MPRKRQYTTKRRIQKVDVLKIITICTGILGLVKLTVEIIKLLT